MPATDTSPSPRGMDRDSDAYRAAIRAATQDPPALDAEQKATLRGIFAALLRPGTTGASGQVAS